MSIFCRHEFTNRTEARIPRGLGRFFIGPEHFCASFFILPTGGSERPKEAQKEV